jgi:atypical dual specificity phosphatase
MSEPHGFSWIDKPRLAAMARPDGVEELAWLRAHGIQVLLSLTEDPPRRDWINEAGLLLMHVPVVDMEPPTQEQLDLCVSTINRANEHGMGVGVHCGAGLGRTGVVLACWFVTQGLNAKNAIARVRRLRPGSVETDEQADAVAEFSRRHRGGAPAEDGQRGGSVRGGVSVASRFHLVQAARCSSPHFPGGLRDRFSCQNAVRAFSQRGSVLWPICGLAIIVFGSGWTLNDAYTVVGAHTVSMKPTPCSDLPLNLRAKFTAS